MKIIILISLLLFCNNIAAHERIAEPNIKCFNNHCTITLQTKDNWKIYSHDDNNTESLNFKINHEYSQNIKDIKIDWNSQNIVSDDLMGMMINYYVDSSDIHFDVITQHQETNYQNNFVLALNINYAACNQYCATFQDTIIYRSNQ